jgi:hypothetical protein
MIEWLEKVASPIAWLYRVLTERAKLRVELKTRDAMSVSGPSSDLLTLRWKYTVIVTNMSKQDALELEVLETNSPQLARLPVPHVRALESISVDLRLSKDVDRQAVLSAEAGSSQRDFWGQLAPPELKDLRLVLSCKNDHGRPAYTVYSRREGADHNEYRRTKPKRAAA